MILRTSKETEREEILDIHRQAFGEEEGPVIAKLVDELLDDETAAPILSLVAVEHYTLLGHILFTKVTVSGSRSPLSAQILAPLAVLPDTQKMGIGVQLIHEGLRRLRESGTDLVFVLGHPEYYPRCGFIPAGAQGFSAPYPIPVEHAGAWMVQELRPGALEMNSGTIRCSNVLNQPQYWRE